MRSVIVLDWSVITTTEMFFENIFSQIKAPDWHGDNLNALYDSMVVGGINEEEPPYVISNMNVSKIPSDMADFQKEVLMIFIDSAVRYSGSAITIE